MNEPLSADDARELSRTAANVRTWTAKRNDAIRRIRAKGAGLREIARATDLDVSTVSNILKPRSRGATSKPTDL